MDNSLEHGIFGWTKKNHKYVSRKKGKNGKWQYFYDKVSTAIKSVAKTVSSALSKVFDKSQDVKVNTITITPETKAKVETTVKAVGKTKVSEIKAKYKKVTMKAYKYIAKVPTGNGKFRYFYTQEEYASYQNRQKVLDKDYDFMSNVPAVSSKRSPQQAAEYVDVGTDNGNCGSCAMAFELQMRGYDVQSSKDIDGVTNDEMLAAFDAGEFKSSYNWYVDTTKDRNKKYYSSGFLGLKTTSEEEQLQIAKNDLEETIKERGGNNQRGFMTIGWTQSDKDETGKRNRSGGGHIFNYVVTNGEVKFYDAQKGEKNNQTGGEIDITTYLDNTNVLANSPASDGGVATYCSVMRVDNHDLSESCKDYVSYKSEEIHTAPKVIETDIYLPDKEEKHG